MYIYICVCTYLLLLLLLKRRLFLPLDEDDDYYHCLIRGKMNKNIIIIIREQVVGLLKVTWLLRVSLKYYTYSGYPVRFYFTYTNSRIPYVFHYDQRPHLYKKKTIIIIVIFNAANKFLSSSYKVH